jgi:AbrB family looped-hinge helix DNA binding protein
MVEKQESNFCCPPMGCCKVEAVVTVDERGQMVLPKEIREKANIKAGDKLAIISCGLGSEISCIALIKADGFESMLKNMLGPMFKGIFG